MGAKKFSHTHRSTMCGLKKLASGVFPESWKVLAERRRRRRRRDGGNGPKTISPPVTRGDLMISSKWSFSSSDKCIIACSESGNQIINQTADIFFQKINIEPFHFKSTIRSSDSGIRLYLICGPVTPYDVTDREQWFNIWPDPLMTWWCQEDLWPLLLTWINFNPSMVWISDYMPRKVWDEIAYSFLNFNSTTVEV